MWCGGILNDDYARLLIIVDVFDIYIYMYFPKQCGHTEGFLR